MPDLNKILLFRMTHMQNIPHILQHGITHIQSPNSNPNYVSIGDGSLINSRSQFLLPNGRKLGDYIPFYFGFRMPMLYVIQHGFNGVNAIAPENIVYCVSSVASIEQYNPEYIFTNGHAIDGLTSSYTPDHIQDIENIIDKSAITSKYWRDDNDLDLKRRKEVEFLVHGDIPPAAVLGFIVFNDAAAGQIQAMAGLGNKKLVIKPEYYF